ncbi:MAG: VOC family protein [Bacteroidetes bacterium]|nr:MAG: VOC family protein [Bacteroidota bacterium]
MKKLTLILIIVIMAMISSNTMAQSEFSSGLIGVGVITKDITKSLDFYLNVIGMTRVSEFDVDETFGKISGLTEGIAFHVDVLKLQDSPGANQWKLMSFKKEVSHPMPKYIHDDTGMQYITIHVNSLDPVLKRIKDNNVKLLGETPVPLGEKDHFVLVQDPDGTIIELIGPLN